MQHLQAQGVDWPGGGMHRRRGRTRSGGLHELLLQGPRRDMFSPCPSRGTGLYQEAQVGYRRAAPRPPEEAGGNPRGRAE